MKRKPATSGGSDQAGTRKISSFFLPKAPSQGHNAGPSGTPDRHTPPDSSAKKRHKGSDHEKHEATQVIDLSEDVPVPTQRLQTGLQATAQPASATTIRKPTHTNPTQPTTNTTPQTHEQQAHAKSVLCRPTRAQSAADSAAAAAAAAASDDPFLHSGLDNQGHSNHPADRRESHFTPEKGQSSASKLRTALAAGKKSGSATVSASGVKYTPLECQVVELQRQNPDTVLVVEVGGQTGQSAGVCVSQCCITAVMRATDISQALMHSFKMM